MPKILQTETSRKRALLTAALLTAAATAQWSLGSESAPAAGAEGAIVVAQNQPRCGQDPQHPCPKGQQPPQQKQAPQQQQQQPPPQRQQAQPQPQQPQLRQQAQPQQQNPAQTQQQERERERQERERQNAQPKQNLQNQPAQQGQQPPQQRFQQPAQGQPPQNPGQAQQLERERQERERQNAQPKQNPQNQPVQQGQQPPQQRFQQPAQGQPPQQQPPQQQGQQPPQQRFQQPAQGQPPQQQQQQQGRLPAQGQPQGQQPAQTFQRVRPGPGQSVQPGQQPVPNFANVQELRNQRHERTEPGGRIVIEEPDHRMIVREGNQAFIRHDENERLFLFGQGRTERRGNEVYSVIVRPDGDEIVTVTDPDGRLVRRFRRDRGGREFVLIDNRMRAGPIFLDIPPPVITIPPDQYIVDTAVAPEPYIYQTLMAPPLVPIERPYSLDEIRYNVALRDRMRRIDVDTINFDFGSWEVAPDQVGRLGFIAQAVQQVLARNPNEVFLIEGHTDAVGQDVDNLSLSDHRAETVADILTENYQIPPENLTTQGYGAHFLKIQTPDANRQNRRVTVRRITPLLNGGQG